MRALDERRLEDMDLFELSATMEQAGWQCRICESTRGLTPYAEGSPKLWHITQTAKGFRPFLLHGVAESF